MEKFSKEQLEKYAFDELDEVEDRELLDRMGADLLDNPDGQVSLYFRKREEENSRCFDLEFDRILRAERDAIGDVLDDETSEAGTGAETV